MKRYANPRGTLLFIVLAVSLMILADFFFEELLAPKAPLRRLPPVETVQPEPVRPPAVGNEQEALPPRAAEKMGPAERFGPPEPFDQKPKIAIPAPGPYQGPEIVQGHPKIAIIIDDMGVDRKRSREVIGIDAPLTLAFLPYAAGVRELAGEARAAGHELMIHMPMEAMDGRLNLGGIALREGMSPEEIGTQLEKAFEAFDGYAGMNNHMGSRLTQEAQVMAQVMQKIKRKGLYFIDSKTIGDSVAADVARAYGLETGERDVFLDHRETDEFVRASLREAEAVARRKGYAIAIGHPKDVTIRGLKAWAADVQKRGYVLVHASALVQKPARGISSSGPEIPQSPVPPPE